MSIGEAYAARIMEAVMAGPTWPQHRAVLGLRRARRLVRPRAAEAGRPPRRVPPEITVPPDQPGAYDYTGLPGALRRLSP